MSGDRPMCSVCGVRPQAIAAAWIAAHCSACSQSFCRTFKAILDSETPDNFPTDEQVAAWEAKRRARVIRAREDLKA